MCVVYVSACVCLYVYASQIDSSGQASAVTRTPSHPPVRLAVMGFGHKGRATDTHSCCCCCCFLEMQAAAAAAAVVAAAGGLFDDDGRRFKFVE